MEYRNLRRCCIPFSSFIFRFFFFPFFSLSSFTADDGQRSARPESADRDGPAQHADQPAYRQRPARGDPAGPQPLPRGQAPVLPALLLPVQRRAAGDPLGDQGPAARAAASEEVLRGH